MTSVTSIFKQLCNTATAIACATQMSACSGSSSHREENLTADTSDTITTIAPWLLASLALGGLVRAYFKKNNQQQATQTATNSTSSGNKLHFRGIGRIVG